MRTKEQYYEDVLAARAVAANPEVTKCTCPNTYCDWFGKCKECVGLHRLHGDHIPFCLQVIVEDKLRALAGALEMEATHKGKVMVTREYWEYVEERDAEKA